MQLTQTYLKERLHYDPDTGLFRWKPRAGEDRCTKSWNAKFVGMEAGSLHDRGYVKIRIDNKDHYAHRLAWYYVTGAQPTETIDHAHGNRSDNRFCNLRAATYTQNLYNAIRHSFNTSGYKSVGWHKLRKKWRSVIRIEGRSVHLGLFGTKEEAYEAY